MKDKLVRIILAYLRFFSHVTIKKNHMTIIGITGSAGKSSARTILYNILKEHFHTKEIHGNSETGIPLGILDIKLDSLGFQTPLRSMLDWLRILVVAPFSTHNLKGVEYLIVEMGIDDPYPPKNMEYLLTIVKPHIAIYLNAFAGAVHSMQFEKILPKGKNFTEEEKREMKSKAIAAEKAKIITQSDCKVGIYNADNPYVVESLDRWDNKRETPLLTFGEKNGKSIHLTDYTVSLKGTTFAYKLNEVNEPLNITIPGYLLQKDFGSTIAAVILAAMQTGLSLTAIKRSLEKNFSLPKSRATMLHGINNSIIIDSSYNASGSTVEGMLTLLAILKKATKRPTVFLFGDMRELGDEAKREHENVAKKIIGIVDQLYCVGSLTKEYVMPKMKQNARWFAHAQLVGEYMKLNLPKDAIVLVKGSQNTIFLEEAIKHILTEKKDEQLLCRQEVYWLKKKAAFFKETS